MGIREEMQAMMNGNYTEQVMGDEEKAIRAEAENATATDNSQQNGTQVNDNQQTDNSQTTNPTETGGEITGNVEGETEPPAIASGEDTAVVPDVNAGINTNDDGVAQNQEIINAQADSTTGDSQLDKANSDQSKTQQNDAGENTGELNYKVEYEKLLKDSESMKAFRDTVTADFKANGKMVKGIDDADKIVKNLQMSTGLTKKLSELKGIKPFIEPLQKRGLLQDTAKFDLQMKMLDGDVGAIKQFLKESNIDPIDLDIEDDFSYQADSTRMSKEEEIFGDMQETASNYGVQDQFTTTVLNEWDSESAGKLFDGENGRAMAGQLAQQMSNGVYDKVSAISENMKITEPGFNSLSSIDQYNKASMLYNQSIRPEPQVGAQVETQVPAASNARETVEDMQARIRAEVKSELEASSQEKLAADYKAKVIAEQKLENDRINAASFSQDRSANNAPPSKGPQTLAEKQVEWNKMLRM